MVGWAGLEPATNGLKGRCSTIELPTRVEAGTTEYREKCVVQVVCRF